MAAWKYLFSLVVIICAFVADAKEQRVNRFYGDTELRDRRFAGTVEVMGVLTFGGLTVRGHMDVHGAATSDSESAFDTLSIRGAANLKDTQAGELTVYGPLNGEGLAITEVLRVYGPVTLKDSTLRNVEVAADNIVLDSCNINKLTVLDRKDGKKQTVILEGNTALQNDIVFESSLGEVLVKSDKVKTKAVVGGFLRK